DLKPKRIPQILVDSAVASAVIMIIMATVQTFAYVLTRAKIPQAIAEGMLSITSNKYILLFLFNIVVLIAGMFMQSSAAIALLTPILLPVLTAVGISPYLVGIIFIVNMAIGMITPPVGSCLYVATNITNISFGRVSRAAMPYVLMEVIVLF